MVECTFASATGVTLEYSQSPTAVFADFGLTEQLVSPVALLTSCVGTYSYMAPEDATKLNLENSNPSIFANDGYGKASDMWSLGITLFQMLFGAFPFEWGDGPHDKLANILSMDVSTLNKHGRISNNCMELISNLLVVDADKRYTVDDALECAWLTEPTAEGVSSPTASAVEESSLSTEITVELTPPSTESVVELLPPTPPPQPPKRKWRLPDPPTRTYYSRKAKRGPINYKW
ncbi:kinase-like domain-containing protein [Syncephalis plumigaleata]|nr:kinase-like domain-containing protein [Syncephalis plumigaleata]